MNTRRIRTACLLSVLSVLICSQALSAQKWSPKQQEVWRNVEGIWAAWANGDVQAWYNLVSDDHRGWTDKMSFPATKKSNRKWDERWASTHKVILHRLFPLAIDLHGDVGVAFYNYEVLFEDKDGKEIREKGRWTEIHRKTDGKWLLIVDCGVIGK